MRPNWLGVGSDSGLSFTTSYLVRRRFVEAKVQNTTDLLVPIEIALYDI